MYFKTLKDKTYVDEYNNPKPWISFWLTLNVLHCIVEKKFFCWK